MLDLNYMTLRAYIILMAITTLICWITFGIVVWMINPESTNWIGFLLFYLSLFLSLVGTTAIAGFITRFIALKRELVFNSVKEAFRQSFLFSFLIISSLLLLSQNLFTWTNLILLVGGLSVLEFFMLGNNRHVAS